MTQLSKFRETQNLLEFLRDNNPSNLYLHVDCLNLQAIHLALVTRPLRKYATPFWEIRDDFLSLKFPKNLESPYAKSDKESGKLVASVRRELRSVLAILHGLPTSSSDHVSMNRIRWISFLYLAIHLKVSPQALFNSSRVMMFFSSKSPHYRRVFLTDLECPVA